MAEIQRRVMDIVWAYNSQDDLWLWHTCTHTLSLYLLMSACWRLRILIACVHVQIPKTTPQ